MPSKHNPIVPCLWFDDQAEEAARFYIETFRDGRILATSHYPESSDNPSGKPRGSVLTVEFEIAGQRFTALNGGPHFTINPSISFFANLDTPAAVDRLFGALAEGGDVIMPLDEYPWSPRYGWVEDRFGVSWQVFTGDEREGAPTITPCLMFTGPQRGRAQEAIETYTRILPDGHIGLVVPYEESEGGVGIKFGSFSVAGQDLAAMDSHAENDFTFNEAVSLALMCENQAEVDRYWAALSEGGEPGPCGWLEDRFGVHWQIVPANIVHWLASDDVAARDRAFEAVMTMGKLDIAAIEKAYASAAGG